MAKGNRSTRGGSQGSNILPFLAKHPTRIMNVFNAAKVFQPIDKDVQSEPTFTPDKPVRSRSGELWLVVSCDLREKWYPIKACKYPMRESPTVSTFGLLGQFNTTIGTSPSDLFNCTMEEWKLGLAQYEKNMLQLGKEV